MRASELLRFPNLLSLSRIPLAPLMGYFLWRDDNQSTIICIALLMVAAITDLLDGYLARRMNQVSRLGIILDPLTDKILVAALVIMLIFFRDLPLWLAIVIVGRDLLISAGAMALFKRNSVVIPAKITGKYTLAAIVLLLSSYIIRFEFGVTLMTYIAVALIAASTIVYARSFALARRGRPLTPFADRTAYKITRTVVAMSVLGVYLYRLYLFLSR